MFQTAETGARIDKEEFERCLPDLRVQLVNAQYDLREADFPFILVVAGDDWITVDDILDGLGEWMDGRYIDVHAMGPPDEEERERPRFWRYWRRLPGDGQMAAFADAWGMAAVRERLSGELDEHDFEHRLAQISSFEGDQAADGALLIKLWLHVPRAVLSKRLKRAKKDPKRAWRVGPATREILDRWDEAMSAAQRLIEVTDGADRPWHVIEAADRRTATFRTAETILTALRGRLDAPKPDPRPAPMVTVAPERGASVLSTVDLTKSLSREEYKKRLEKRQRKLFELTQEAKQEGVSTILAFEGWDAAGKGGVIRRITRATDSRSSRTIPVAAPNDEEDARHYLWRFWRQLPRAGRLLIFDRSWYGRVLVERVEGFAREDEWRRAYSEINDFEEQLCEFGMVVLKFWLHIDPEEQLARFEAREQTPYKKYKITNEDYRNREKWGHYEAAVDEMVERTSTSHAPWHLIPSNDKRYARVATLETICDALEKRL
jgi:polyphosphate:AMP phosphotransferase